MAVTTRSRYLLLPKYVIIFLAFDILAYRACNHLEQVAGLYTTQSGWSLLFFSQFSNLFFSLSISHYSVLSTNSASNTDTNLLPHSFGLPIDLLSISYITDEIMTFCPHHPDFLCGLLQAFLSSTPKDDLQQETFVRVKLLLLQI